MKQIFRNFKNQISKDFLEWAYVLGLCLKALVRYNTLKDKVEASIAGIRASGMAALLLVVTILISALPQTADMLESIGKIGKPMFIEPNLGASLALLFALALFGNALRLSARMLLALNNFLPENKRRRGMKSTGIDPNDSRFEYAYQVALRLPYFYQSLLYTLMLYFLAHYRWQQFEDNPWEAWPAYVGYMLMGIVMHYAVAYLLLFIYRLFSGPVFNLFKKEVTRLFPNRETEYDIPLRTLMEVNTGDLTLNNPLVPIRFASTIAVWVVLAIVWLLWGGSLQPGDAVFDAFSQLGSVPTLLVGLSFWLFIACVIDLLDNGFPLPLKRILLVWVVWLSYNDYDHLASGQRKEPIAYHLNSNRGHFKAWMTENHPGWDTAKTATPVLFINIEGGASRSGYWGARVLDSLDRMLVAKGVGPLSRSTYSYSCVSGGNLGAHAFLTFQHMPYTRRDSAFNDFFLAYDMFFPISYKFSFGEPLLWIQPRYLASHDRAVAFENNVAYRMNETLKRFEKDTNMQDFLRWDQPFFKRYQTTDPCQPVFMANAAEVETGRRAVLCNVRFDREQYFPNTSYEVTREIPHYYPTVAAAMHFSARFPLASPSGGFRRCPESRPDRHLVDGGVIENQGNSSTEELIMDLNSDPDLQNRFKPLVINVLNSSERPFTGDPDTVRIAGKVVLKEKPNRLFNEVTDVLLGLYSARSGHGNLSAARLRGRAKSLGGEKAEVDFGCKALPLNWYVSHLSSDSVRLRLGASFKRDDFGFVNYQLQNLLYLLGAEKAPRPKKKP